MLRAPFVLATLSASVAFVAVACGSRTGLLDDELVGPGPGPDAGVTNPRDGSHEADAGFDARPPNDALPPIDVGTPPDAVRPTYCTDVDAGSTLIYLVSSEEDLLRFDPVSQAATFIGPMACPTTGTCLDSMNRPVAPTPFSMAVDETGVAYVVYCDGELFRVSTATAGCAPTGFAVKQGGFPTNFGMCFAENASQTGEDLFVAGNVPDGGSILASIDPTTFALRIIGPFSPPIGSPELTGTGTGGLFGFTAIDDAGSAIAQIDPNNADIVALTSLPAVDQGDAWAFAFWGGDFYTFTSPFGPPWNGTTTRVQRFRPRDGSVVDIIDIPATIVGAGVSTCAPVQ